MDEPVDERSLSRLRWRCRRGLLENDLIIERFFARFGSRLTKGQADALSELMELADNDLLDLLLARTELHGELDRPGIRELLAMLRSREGAPLAGH